MVHIFKGAITQTSNIAMEIMKLCQWSERRWTLEENTPSEVSTEEENSR